MKTGLIAMTMLGAALAAGAARADQFPVSVVDDRGKTVVIAAQPRAVASISSFGADLMGALGRDVVGMSSMGNRKPAYLGARAARAVDLGAAHETSMELLTGLKPDLTIGIRTYTEMFEKKFEAIGSFVAYDLITTGNSRSAVASASAAAGFAAQGRKLNDDFDRKLDEAGKRAPGGVSAIFIWHWVDILWVHYDHYMTADMMRALKAKNVAGASPTPELVNPHARVMSMEQLLKLNPDYIFSFQAGGAPVQAHPVWARLKAVKNGHAYRVGSQYAEVHGPIARQMVLDEMAHLLYPQVFPMPPGIPQAARARPLRFKQ
jgi:iron complex transport system substrate-binding protein